METFGQLSQNALIRSKGCILGQVSSVRRGSRQHVNIISRNVAWDLGSKTEGIFQASTKPIQEHEIICLLSGASKPSIIRLCKDHFIIGIIAAAPPSVSSSSRWSETSQWTTNLLRGFLLVWDWEQPLSQDAEEYETLTKK